jgi:hypothetical protein
MSKSLSECIICYEVKNDFECKFGCSHSVCQQCSDQIDKCPVCRQRVTQICKREEVNMAEEFGIFISALSDLFQFSSVPRTFPTLQLILWPNTVKKRMKNKRVRSGNI